MSLRDVSWGSVLAGAAVATALVAFAPETFALTGASTVTQYAVAALIGGLGGEVTHDLFLDEVSFGSVIMGAGVGAIAAFAAWPIEIPVAAAATIGGLGFEVMHDLTIENVAEGTGKFAKYVYHRHLISSDNQAMSPA